MVDENFKQQVIAENAKVAGMRVFKTRMGSDGWHFCAAFNRREAAKKLGVNELSISTANADDVIRIACRALEGV